MAKDDEELDDKKSIPEDEDQVSAAYENINKRLESLKKGGDVDDGPKKQDEDEVEEDEAEEDQDQDEDPLDREDDDDDEEKKKDQAEEDEVEDLAKKPEEEEEEVKEDTLDDLADEVPTRPTKKFNMDETDMDIPNLKRPADNFGPVQNPYREEPLITQKNPFQNSYASVPRNRGSNKVHLLILILIGLAVIGGTVYLLKSQFEGISSPPAPSATPEASPTPIPSPSFDRAKYKIRVLNGTTKAGLAASVSAKLKDLGYQIDKTGNAPKQNYTTTEVKTKSATPDLSEQLVKDLPSEFSGASSSGELKDSDSADGEVILGTK